ncbi:SIR2 family protein [Staphylococcus sp. 17KM0847]|uniref:SIR2 family protein n=1 Tax=Staphylococcus sp. 17KM0847 TaxID=2583989 RepID=UPI0015DC6DC4|nr:SIR2 family protein [Staphylococcus sp. 17KM0847]QLK86588.1 SIR2 family protein [Staphylococcus sp. 17KM0847]
MNNKFISKSVIFSKDDSNKYYKDEKELLDKDESINEDIFNKLIANEIFAFMGPFDNIILLVGAGASVVGNKDKNYGYTVDMLGEEIRNQLQEPYCFTLDKLTSMCKYSQSSEDYFNLEDFLSQLQSFSPFVSGNDKSKFNNSFKKIIEIIKEKTSYDYDESKFKHGVLINQLTNLHKAPNRLSVVTTNYDIVVEESAYSLNYTVFDGFTFAHTPIFDIDMFEWHLSKPISEVRSQKESYKKNVLNLLKIHGSLTWERQNNNIIRKNKGEVINPIMIFPSSNKYMQSYEKPYFDLFTKFQSLLRKSNTVLITSGFSFADNHISQMIIQAIKTNPSLTLLVTDYIIEPEQPNENWQELLKLMKSDYNISFLQATMNNDLTYFFSRGENSD